MKKLLLSSLLLTALPSLAADKLTLMLDWFINPDQAPIIIAEQKGFFAEQGLAVEIIEPSDTSVAPKMAAAKQVDLAFDSQPHLYMQLQEGLPLMKVATIVASPLNNLLMRQDSGIKQLADLKGKTIGYSVAGYDRVILETMLKSANLSLDDVKLVNVNWSIAPSLLSKQVDGVIGAFRIFENIELELAGVTAHSFAPEDYGIPTYEEMIIVAHQDLATDDRLARFNTALQAAVDYMQQDSEGAWQAFKSYRDNLDDELNRRAWQAVLPTFAAKPAAHDSEKYHRFGQFMHNAGLTEQAVKVPFYQAP